MIRISFVLVAMLLSACSPVTTPSSQVTTNNMYALFSAIDDGTMTTVTAHLQTKPFYSYPDISLTEGDIIYASAIGPTSALSDAQLTSFTGISEVGDGF